MLKNRVHGKVKEGRGGGGKEGERRIRRAGRVMKDGGGGGVRRGKGRAERVRKGQGG